METAFSVQLQKLRREKEFVNLKGMIYFTNHMTSPITILSTV